MDSTKRSSQSRYRGELQITMILQLNDSNSKLKKYRAQSQFQIATPLILRYIAIVTAN